MPTHQNPRCTPLVSAGSLASGHNIQNPHTQTYMQPTSYTFQKGPFRLSSNPEANPEHHEHQQPNFPAVPNPTPSSISHTILLHLEHQQPFFPGIPKPAPSIMSISSSTIQQSRRYPPAASAIPFYGNLEASPKHHEHQQPHFPAVPKPTHSSISHTFLLHLEANPEPQQHQQPHFPAISKPTPSIMGISSPAFQQSRSQHRAS